MSETLEGVIRNTEEKPQYGSVMRFPKVKDFQTLGGFKPSRESLEYSV